MNENFNAGNVPPNPFSPIQTPDTFNRQRLQEELAMFQDPRLDAQDRITNDPETGAPIVVDELSYLTLEQQYPDYMANRSAARLEDQDTIMSKNSMGLEDSYQAAADGRIRSTYRYSTRSWLNQYEFLTDLDKEMFVVDSLNDEIYEQEVLDLTDNGVLSYAFLGGSKQLGAAQDIPNSELAAMNATMNTHALQAQVASPEAIIKSFSLLLGERAEDSELIAQGLEGDEEAIEKMKVQVQKAHISYRERDDRVAQRLIDIDHTVAPELKGYVDDLRSASEGFDSAADRKLVEQFAQASAIRRFEHKVNYATHDFLDASKMPEERSSALRLIQLGAKVYGPDFIQNAFTNVREKGFDVNTAWSKMDKPTQEMVARLGITLEALQERGFDPKNTITFTYQVQQEMNRRIGADERQVRIMRDYDWEITRMTARLGYDAYRGIADDPVAFSEIGPGIVGGIGIGAGAAAIGLGGLASFGIGATAGGAEAGIQTLYTSSEAQRQQMQQGLITSVSSGQMVQDAMVIGATSVLLEGAFASLGYGIGKSIAGGRVATSLAAKTGLLGEENKNFAIAKELQQNLSNDDIAGIRIVAPNLTQQQQVLLQTREVDAVEAVKVAIESKVTDASSTDTLGDLLSPSVLDAQGISQLEAANFVQGVLRDLGPEEKMDAKTLGELWTAYATQRKEAFAKPDAPKSDRVTRLQDELVRESDEVVDDLLFDSRITKEPTADLMDEVTILTNRIINGESVEPDEFAKIIDVAVRTRSKATQQKFRDFFNTDKAKALIGEKNIDKINARLDEVLATTKKVREADPDLDAATRVAGFFQRASDESSIRARGDVGYTKNEIIKGVTAYIRTAGNPTARTSLEARWGKGKLQSLINKLNSNVEDVFERTEVQAYDIRAFKASDAYKDIRARKTARAELASSLRRATKKASGTDRRKATKSAKRAYKKSIEKINKKATTKIDGDLDIGIEEVEARIKSFDTMTPIERRLAMAEGFSRLIDKVDPEAVSNAPVANDKKGMNRLFAGSNFGDGLERAWANIALWPVSQSKLFRSRTRVVRGLANFIGNRHIGTTKYGDVSGSTVEGAVNAAKRQIAPILGALRSVRAKMSRTAFGQFQSGVMRMRMTGQMALVRKASPEERGKLLSSLPRELQDAYSSRPDDLFDDLLAIDDMITNYNRQVLEEAKIAGLMKLDPDGNPLQKIDPSRYVPNNLNPNLTTSQRARLVDRITDLAKEQAMDSTSSLNTDVMVGLGWIKPTAEALKLDPHTGKAASDVTYEVPEDSIFFGITGKGSEADAEFVLKNARRGRAWLEEIAGAVRERANTTAPVTRNVANSRNFGSKDQPRPTSARGTARAANEETYITGFDPVLAELQQRGAAMRAVDMTNMEPEELVNHLRTYDDLLTDMAIRQAEIAEAYRRGDLITPNGSTVSRPNVSESEIARLARNDEAFANISPGHNEMLGRLDTLIKNGTISVAHKRMLMSVFAPLDLNRAVGLSMHTRSPLDLKMRQLWEYDRQVGEDLEADGIFNADRVREEVDADIVDDPSILDEFSDDAETFGSAIRTQDGGSVDLQRDLKRNQNVNAAATVLHELNHVLFFNASPEVQAAAQHMFNTLRKGGVDSPTGRLMQANGMSKEDIRYAMSNVHEFVAHMGEIVLGGNSIKLARRGGEGFFIGLMNSLRDLFERLVFRPDMDRLAGKAGLNNETWGDVKELLNSIYSGVKEQTRIADVIRSRYTSFEDNLTMRFETRIDNVGDVLDKKSGLDENDWREEVLRAVRLSDPDFNDLPYEDQAAMLKGYYNDKGLVKEFFDIDPPSAEKKSLPVFEIDVDLARPDYASLSTGMEGARSKLEDMEAMRMAFLQDEDGNPRVLSDVEEAQYRMVDEAVESLRSRIAADEFTLETSKMSDEGYQRLLFILDHTDGLITESYIKNIIRNDGVHIPTTGGNAGVVTESLNTIIKKAKLDFKQANKQTAEKMGASGGGAEAPTASELSLGEAAATDVREVNDINSGDGVAELANTIGFMSRTIRDSLSDEDRTALDVGIVLLEILERAHKENWPISSTLLDEFQYVPTATDIGVNAMKKLVKENSLHPYTWSKLDKDIQKAIKAEYKGYLKASQISSPKPTLDKMFAVLKRAANTEDLAKHFGESKEQIVDDGIKSAKGYYSQSENKFVEASENALEQERVLTEAKNNDNRSAEEHMEDLQDEMVAKNPIVSSVTAANAAGEVGSVAPGYPVQVKELLDAAREAESVRELTDNLNLLAPGDYRNGVVATDTAILLYHAGEWKGDTDMMAGIHLGSSYQALTRAVVRDNDLRAHIDTSYDYDPKLPSTAKPTQLTSVILPKGSKTLRVPDTGSHDRVGDFISEALGNHPGLRAMSEDLGIDHDAFWTNILNKIDSKDHWSVSYATLGKALKDTYGIDFLTYRNSAEGSEFGYNREGERMTMPNDSIIVTNPDIITQRATAPAVEHGQVLRDAERFIGRDTMDIDRPPVVDRETPFEWWEANGPAEESKPPMPAPVDDFYNFVDIGDNNPDVREYEFENKAGDIMQLDINRAVTADGDEAIGVAFHRKADAEESPNIYDKKTGSGDARRMLTAVMNQAFDDADEMGVDNIVFTRTRGDGDRAYGMLLKRGLRGNPDWHVKTIDKGLSEIEWVIARGLAPEDGPEIRGIKPEDVELEQNLITALTEQTQMLAEGKPIIPQVAAALIADANELVERVSDLDSLATSVSNLEREMSRYESNMKAKADKEAREAAGEVDDRPVFGEEPKAEEPKADTGGGGEEPPKDKPTAEGSEEPDDFRKAFMKEYSDDAIDKMLNVGKKPGSDSVPGKLNNNGKHAGQDLISVYDDGVNGKGTTDLDGNGIDPIQDRSKQYVDTNATDTAAVRSNNAEGIDLDILIGRTSGGIDETMSRRFDDADFETEIGQEIAEIFADNMDLTTNLMNYARGTGSRVKIQAMLNDAFGKGVDMSKLFKEAHDSIVELIQTDSKNGTLSAAKAKSALAEAEETTKQMKLMFLNTLGYNVTQFDRASGVGKATNIAKNLAYSKLGGGFSQMVALVEAPFATLRTAGMGPLQILNNMTSLLGGIFMAGAGVVGRNVPGMGRLASEYGIDKKGARFLSEDLVTFLDNFDGTSAMARFGFTGDQGNIAAFTFKDRALAQADRVRQASSGESRGADEGWTGATIEAATGAVADMTGVMSGMEQVTSIARSIGVNIGRTSLSKYGGKLKMLAKELRGQQIDKKEFIAQARKLGIPRPVAIRANHAGLLADGGRALEQLEAVGGVRYGTSNGKQIDLNQFNDRMQKDHAALRSQGYLDDTVEEQIIADNKAIEAVQEYLLGFSRQASPELKGSLAMSKGDPIQQFLFSFLSYPMAAYQELVANGFKANGVASTAGVLALLASFEFNARMIRTMNDGTEEDREKAKKMWMDTFTGQLSMEQYLYVMANYGTQSPAFGHFGGWMGDILNAGLDSMVPEDQAHPVGDLKKQFPQSPFASPVVGTVQGVASSLRRGATTAAKAAFGNSDTPTTYSSMMRRDKNMAKDLGTAIDVFTPFNSGAIQALSQITTGHKLGAAIGNAAFVGQKGAGLNASGATPPGFWESRKNRGYNQVNQFSNPADAPDYQKRLQDRMMATPPPVWTSEKTPSEGLVDSLPDQ